HLLTAAEKRAARTLLSNYPTIGLAPVAEFAREAGASPATVLRFLARLGFSGYPEFHRALRDELDERIKTPLQKTRSAPVRGEDGSFLDRFVDQAAANMRETVARIPASEFEAVCHRIATTRGACHIIGGRFTDAVAGYMVAHLRIIRPGVRRLEPRAANRVDQFLDIKPGDVAVVFDVRRYDQPLARTTAALAAAKAHTILITDQWISPVSKHARLVLPCQIDIGRTWDSNTALFAVVEAIIARSTELLWDSASKRIAAIEKMQGG
ncbi:MAG TPA: MurR/RpiR family transcriptional regulator, partial [Thermohalobaculum sp.]|nr:MurR/RpiR family transcriptional regulator [Thermohalobaculum sp.]